MWLPIALMEIQNISIPHAPQNHFGTPSIFRERLKLETSNLASRLATWGTNNKNAKLGLPCREQGHMTYFF